MCFYCTVIVIISSMYIYIHPICKYIFSNIFRKCCKIVCAKWCAFVDSSWCKVKNLLVFDLSERTSQKYSYVDLNWSLLSHQKEWKKSFFYNVINDLFLNDIVYDTGQLILNLWTDITRILWHFLKKILVLLSLQDKCNFKANQAVPSTGLRTPRSNGPLFSFPRSGMS